MTGRRRTSWYVARLGAAAAAVWLISLVLVLTWSIRDEADKGDAIVVLGAAQWDGRPSPVLRARLEHAQALWSAGHAPWLVVTGGVGAGDTTSEAAVGRRFLLQRGIPADRILLEPHGRTTLQSMRVVASMLQERQLQRVLLVSDPFHMLRLNIVAWSYGLKSLMSPTRSSPISRNTSELVTYILAESFKVPFTLGGAVTARAWRAVAG